MKLGFKHLKPEMRWDDHLSPSAFLGLAVRRWTYLLDLCQYVVVGQRYVAVWDVVPTVRLCCSGIIDDQELLDVTLCQNTRWEKNPWLCETIWSAHEATSYCKCRNRCMLCKSVITRMACHFNPSAWTSSFPVHVQIIPALQLIISRALVSRGASTLSS